MELFFICLFILLAFFSKFLIQRFYKEGLDSNPMDVVQSQQGEIENIRKQLIETQITEESIKEIQDNADKTTDQINTLQENIPDPQVEKYAQE